MPEIPGSIPDRFEKFSYIRTFSRQAMTNHQEYPYHVHFYKQNRRSESTLNCRSLCVCISVRIAYDRSHHILSENYGRTRMYNVQNIHIKNYF